MLEENKAIELNDNEMKKVSGGEIWEYGDKNSCNHMYFVGQEVYYRVGTLIFKNQLLFQGKEERR